MSAVSASDLAALRANYAGKVSLIDHHVGELLTIVEKRGELDRTIVVFTSDHGEMNGDHGLMNKSCFLESALTVPLVIRLPGASAAGARFEAPVQLMDVGPTLAEAAGRPVEHPQWGRSLWPLLRGEARRVRELAFSEQRGEITAVGDRWKVALNRAGETYLCTDLDSDPDELTNLAGTSAGEEVERTYREWLLTFLLGTQLLDDWQLNAPRIPYSRSGSSRSLGSR